MHEIKAIIRPDRLEAVLKALHEQPQLPGVTVSRVHGYGRHVNDDLAAPSFGETVMIKLEIIVSAEQLRAVVDTIQAVARTGRGGDGKIFISDIRDAITIHSGATGAAAI